MAQPLMIQSIVTDNRITAKFSDNELPKYARHGELYVVNGVLYIYVDLDNTGSDIGQWFPMTYEKEIVMYVEVEEKNIWSFPISFYTHNIHVIVYDQNDRVYTSNFNYTIEHGIMTLSFNESISGKVYIIMDKGFDWVDSSLIVSDRKFAITSDENNFYYIEVDTENLSIDKNGKIIIKNDLSVNGNLDINGDINITGDLKIMGENVEIESSTLTVSDNVITLNNGFVGSPFQNTGIEIDRGSLGKLNILTFNETMDYVEIPVIDSDDVINQEEVATKPFVNNSISDETNRATAAESTLQTNIDNEVTRAQAAETTLQTNIDNEVNRATTAESTLQSNIDNEVTRAQAAETTLQTNIDNEVNRATTAETTLQTNIDNEVNRAIIVEGDINKLQTNSKLNLVSAINENVESINVEKERIDSILSASDADKDSFAEIVSLINSVDIENDDVFANYVLVNDERSDNIEQSISDETNRATTAETTLQSNIDNETNRAQLVEADLNSGISTLTTNIETNFLNKTTSAEQIINPNLKLDGSILTWSLSTEWFYYSLNENLTTIDIISSTNINEYIYTMDTIETIKFNKNGQIWSVLYGNLEEYFLGINSQSKDSLLLNGLNETQFVRTDIDTTMNENYHILKDLTVDGTLTAGTIIETSSIKYKENVKLIETPLEIVSKLDGVRYTWKDTKKDDIGFIAEDVNLVLPELVLIDNGEIEGMNYSKITAVLVEAIKEQQKQIIELMNEVKKLKGE